MMALRPKTLLYVAIVFIGLVLVLMRALHTLQAEAFPSSRVHLHQHWLFASEKTPAERSRGGLRYGYSPNPSPDVSLRCRHRTCAEFLRDQGLDIPHYRYCWRKTQLEREPPQSTCRFIDGAGRSPVGLASFPGSGNTWVRGLLQRVTGICTGGIYCDVTLRASGFPGESIRSGAVLVVKTHQTDPRWTGVEYSKSAPFTYFHKADHIPVYSSGILLIRNPYDALVSEWHREMTVNSTDNHINRVGADYFCESIRLVVSQHMIQDLSHESQLRLLA